MAPRGDAVTAASTRLVEVIRASVGADPSAVLVEQEDVAWLRADDLIAGFVFTSTQTWKHDAARAYAALDALAPENHLQPDEFWSVVLYVQFRDQAATAVVRAVEQDTMGSRKIVVDPQNLLRLPTSMRTPGSPNVAALSRDVVGEALRTCADNPVRSALDVLLDKKRRSLDVDRLIDLLGTEDPVEEEDDEHAGP